MVSPGQRALSKPTEGGMTITQRLDQGVPPVSPAFELAVATVAAVRLAKRVVAEAWQELLLWS